MLLISKIENGQFPESSRIQINSLVHKYLEDFKEVFDYKHIHVSVEESASCEVCMNESLASILVANLLKNAFVHNLADGQIDIQISDHDFVISNTAESGALDEQQIFTRFYQGKKKEQSTGLGLAIVDWPLSIRFAAYITSLYIIIIRKENIFSTFLSEN